MDKLAYFTSTDNFQDVVVVDGLSIEECMKAQRALRKLAFYENTGCTPKELTRMEKLFSERAKELWKYKKQEERLCEIFGGDLTIEDLINSLKNVLTEPNKPHPINCKILTYEEAELWNKYKDRLREIDGLWSEKMSNKSIDVSTNQLEPCPFCGGEGELLDEDDYFGHKIWHVECVECDCCTSGYYDDPGKEEAIRKWNTRNPTERIVEQLENILICNAPLQLHKGIIIAINIVKKGGIK